MRIALIAHDHKKDEMIALASCNGDPRPKTARCTG